MKYKSMYLSLLAGLTLANVCTALADTGRKQGNLPVTQLTIADREGKQHRFSLELADEAHERRTGLMHRKSLPFMGGMIFDFKVTQNVSMWMKDTLIPLDILFVASDGEILTIAENARPGSLRRIPSGAEVRAVIEIAGGEADKLGIRPGDRAVHRVFGNTAQKSR